MSKRSISKFHGLSHTPEYRAWSSMKHRCNNPIDKGYPRYGGRGIKVCERWQESFLNFLEDMGKRPSDKHSIDRIDNDSNYEPNNCRWATAKEQAQNKTYRAPIGILKQCEKCKKDFYIIQSKKDRIRHCSVQCREGWRISWNDRTGIIKECFTCKKEFYVKPSRINSAKYCSLLCRENQCL